MDAAGKEGRLGICFDLLSGSPPAGCQAAFRAAPMLSFLFLCCWARRRPLALAAASGQAVDHHRIGQPVMQGLLPRIEQHPEEACPTYCESQQIAERA